MAGGEYTLGGVFYNPNMPTEECFTSPDKYSANGVVMATKPLSVRGVLVDNFGFRFEKGRVVEVICDNPEHKDVLEKLVSTGNTVLVIEHNLDVIKCADYLIDLGPEGGDNGVTIVGVGTPEEISQIENSYTGQYLKKILVRDKNRMGR